MFDFYPDKTFSRVEVMLHATPVPAVKDIYFWWFKEPSLVFQLRDALLKMETRCSMPVFHPIKKSKTNSRANLRQRIKTHYNGNAEGPTLRRTLEVLLVAKSIFPLRRVVSGK